MVIALLAVLGVNLIVLVAFAAFVFSRERWVKCQPGVFHGAIRVAMHSRYHEAAVATAAGSERV